MNWLKNIWQARQQNSVGPDPGHIWYMWIQHIVAVWKSGNLFS